VNAANRNAKLAPRHKSVFCLLGGLLLTACIGQAATVTLNLGQSAQNITLNGTGPNSSSLGTYVVTLGACTPGATTTTCIVSGAFTSSTPGLESGTYSLATVYSGTGASPLLAVQQAPGSNYFNFSSIPSDATMNLTLVSSSGTQVVPFLADSNFLNGATFGLIYTQAAVCSGTPVNPCAVGTVGLANGSAITGPTTGTAQFNQNNNYYFSQFVFAENWESTLTYNNYSQQSVTCTTNFYGNTGAPLGVPFAQGTVTTRTDVLAPGGSIHDPTTAPHTGTVEQGWAQATCTGPVQASMLFRVYTDGVPLDEAGVNGETAPTTEFATFAQTLTGVAYANPSPTQSATITFTVYDNSGTRLGSQSVTLGPLGHDAKNIGPLLGLSSFTGFVKITSTIPIISLSLNYESAPIFSSLPPGDLPSSTLLVTP
jgi:hypothetical protein